MSGPQILGNTGSPLLTSSRIPRRTLIPRSYTDGGRDQLSKLTSSSPPSSLSLGILGSGSYLSLSSGFKFSLGSTITPSSGLGLGAHRITGSPFTSSLPGIRTYTSEV